MIKFTASVHDSIGDHTKAIIRGESINEDKIYYNAFFDQPENDDITWPQEKELEDLPLAEQDATALDDLDNYIGANIILPGNNREEVLTIVKGRK